MDFGQLVVFICLCIIVLCSVAAFIITLFRREETPDWDEIMDVESYNEELRQKSREDAADYD